MSCKCTFKDENGEYCKLRENCEACRAYHFGRGELVGCCFNKEDEKTHDRSYERYYKSKGEKDGSITLFSEEPIQFRNKRGNE